MPRTQHYLAFAISVLFVAIYSSFYWQTWGLFNSPDENAAFVFAQHFSKEGDLAIVRPDINEIAHPRSVNIRDGQFVPGSFIGWILLLGYAGKASAWLMLLLPALIAVASGWAFWGIVRRVFGNQTAWLSLLILFTLPAWWYYASRGFLPNIAFVSFLLIAAFALIRTRETAAWQWAVVAGLSVGLSLAIRPNELVWLLLAAAMFFPELRQIKPSRWSVIACAAFVPLLITAYWQQQTFGHWYSTGYQSFASSATAAAPAAPGNIFFPFGLDIGQSLARFFSYQVSTALWVFAAAVVGIAAWVKTSQKSAEQKKYARLFLLVSIYLTLYYGSWQFSDHPDASRLTLGVSYGRYWLPIYVLAAPFIVLGCRQIASRLPGAPFTFPLLIVTLFTLNTLAVYRFGDEHLGQLRRNIVEYRQWQDFAYAQTETDAVIISERNDKVFWPGRQVIHYQPGDYQFLADAADIPPLAPMYLFTAIPRDHMRVIEQEHYAPRGLALQYQDQFEGQMALYKIIRFVP